MLDRTATALALDPGLDLAHLARMRVYYHLGLFDEARREGRLAQALNPGYNIEFDRLEIARCSLRVSSTPPSSGQRRKCPEPRWQPSATISASRGYYTGDDAGARAMLASITPNGRPDVRAQASLASIEAALGMREEARERVNDILRGSGNWIITWHTASAPHWRNWAT